MAGLISTKTVKKRQDTVVMLLLYFYLVQRHVRIVYLR